jgi:hypothetical protein
VSCQFKSSCKAVIINLFFNFRFCTDKFGSVHLLCKNHLPFISFHGKVVPYCQSKYKLGCMKTVHQTPCFHQNLIGMSTQKKEPLQDTNHQESYSVETHNHMENKAHLSSISQVIITNKNLIMVEIILVAILKAGPKSIIKDLLRIQKNHIQVRRVDSSNAVSSSVYNYPSNHHSHHGYQHESHESREHHGKHGSSE